MQFFVDIYQVGRLTSKLLSTSPIYFGGSLMLFLLLADEVNTKWQFSLIVRLLYQGKKKNSRFYCLDKISSVCTFSQKLWVSLTIANLYWWGAGDAEVEHSWTTTCHCTDFANYLFLFAKACLAYIIYHVDMYPMLPHQAFVHFHMLRDMNVPDRHPLFVVLMLRVIFESQF